MLFSNWDRIIVNKAVEGLWRSGFCEVVKEEVALAEESGGHLWLILYNIDRPVSHDITNASELCMTAHC